MQSARSLARPSIRIPLRAALLSFLIFTTAFPILSQTGTRTEPSAPLPSSARKTETDALRPADADDAKNKSASFDAERAFAHVKNLVALGPRPPGSKQIEKARKYIVEQLKSYGLKVTTDEFTAETPEGKRKMANVTAELAGESDDFIILASHYDTKLFKEFRFVGANDGGSSTGVLLELARVLSASARKPSCTYRFVFFDGEEAFCREWDECSKPDAPDNTYGSRRYVARLKEGDELKRLRALILLDMVGYRRLSLGRDTLSTRWLVDTIWQTARELGYEQQFVERPEDIGSDDHEPFLKAGVDAVDIIQLNSYPHWHTRDDTLDKISPQALKIVGEVVLASLPRIEKHLQDGTRGRRSYAKGDRRSSAR